jgi:hypothetical protein
LPLYTAGDWDIEVKMDLGDLGSVTAKQTYHQSVAGSVIGVANWGLLLAVAIFFKKNPARVRTFFLSVIIYLLWMVIINHIHFIYWETEFSYRFFFDVLFFWLSTSMLILTISMNMRKLAAIAIEVILLLLSIGLHLLVYGVFWRIQFTILFVTVYFLMTVTGSVIYTRLRHKHSQDKVKMLFKFTMACVLLTIFTLAFYILYRFIWEFVKNYNFTFNRYMVSMYFLDLARYIGGYLLIVIPFAMFYFKHPCWEEIP